MNFRSSDYRQIFSLPPAAVSLAVVLIALLASPMVIAQQSGSEGGAERTTPSAGNGELTAEERAEIMARRAERRRARQILWLREANGSIGSMGATESDGAEPAAPRSRMGGLSPEERHRLRSAIREAGFSVYAGPGSAPGSGRGRP